MTYQNKARFVLSSLYGVFCGVIFLCSVALEKVLAQDAPVLPPPLPPVTRTAAVKVAWNPNPETNIVSYRVWRGLDLLGETAATSLVVDLPTDRTSSLTCQAVNDKGLTSAHSKPLVVAPINVHESGDLKVWKVHTRSTFFVTLECEGTVSPRAFFRFELTAINQ